MFGNTDNEQNKPNEFALFLRQHRISQKNFAELTGLPYDKIHAMYQADTVAPQALELAESIYFHTLSGSNGLSSYIHTVVISFAAHKGGCAKTTSCVSVSHAMAAFKGYKVLYVDCDEQANGTATIMGGQHTEGLPHLFDMINKEDDARNYIVNTPYKNLDIICGSVDTASLEKNLGIKEYLFYEAQKQAKERGVKPDERTTDDILRNCLKGVIEDNIYDFIFIDCPPSLGNTLRTLCAASDCVIVTTNLEKYSIENIPNLVAVTSKMGEKYGCKVLGVLYTRVNSTRSSSSIIENAMENAYPEQSFATRIHSDAKITDSQIAKMPIVEYDRSSRTAKEYMSLCAEIISRCREFESNE